MKIKEFIVCCAAFLVASLMSGCSIANLDSKDLMRPPRPTGEKAQIQHVIEQNAGAEKYTFKYPQSGDYRSAVILSDITGDGEEEALGFYRTKGENPQTHLVIIDEVGTGDNKEWQIVGEFTTAFPEVTEVDFADINGDGAKEIIVGWNANSTVTNVLSVYTYDNQQCTQVSSDEIYYEYAIGDFTQSGFDSILLMNLNSADKDATAALYCYNDHEKKIIQISQTAMDQEVTRIYNVTSGKLDGSGSCAAFADGITGLRYNTQIVYFDIEEFQLKCHTISSGLISEYDSMNIKYSSVYSQDINADGIVDVPICTRMPSDDASAGMEYASLISWCNFDPDSELVTTIRTLAANYYGGFYYIMPDSWAGKVTAAISDDGKTMTFMEYHDGVVGESFLSLRKYSASEWIENGDMGGYSLIFKNDTNAYGYNILSDSFFVPDEQEILNSFRNTSSSGTESAS